MAILVATKIGGPEDDDAALSPKVASEAMLKESGHDLVSLLGYSEAIYRKLLTFAIRCLCRVERVRTGVLDA